MDVKTVPSKPEDFWKGVLHWGLRLIIFFNQLWSGAWHCFSIAGSCSRKDAEEWTFTGCLAWISVLSVFVLSVGCFVRSFPVGYFLSTWVAAWGITLGVGPGSQFPYEDCHEVALGLVGWWRATRSSQGYPQRCRDGSVFFGGSDPRWVVFFCGAGPGEMKGSHLESEFEVTGTYTRDLPYGFLVLACLVIHLAFLRWAILSNMVRENAIVLQRYHFASVFRFPRLWQSDWKPDWCFPRAFRSSWFARPGRKIKIKPSLWHKGSLFHENRKLSSRSAPWGSGRSSWFVVPSLLRQDSPDF